MAATIHIHDRHLLLLLSPKADTHRPTEGGRLSRPRLCRKGAQPVPKAVHRSGCRDKHNWPRPIASLPSMGKDNSPSLTFRLRYSNICAEKGR